MSRIGVLMVLGLLAAIAPYSGLPVVLRSLLDLVLGLAVFGIALTLRMRDMRRAKQAPPSVEALAAPEVFEAESEPEQLAEPAVSEEEPSRDEPSAIA